MSNLAFHGVHTFASRGAELAYLAYDPPLVGEETRPLVLFLHGAGERGSDPERVSTHGIPRAIESGRNLPFVAISPQCPAQRSWSDYMPLLQELLDELTTSMRADPDRIYLTGLSMGGYGAWKLAAEAPTRFAALVPVCGGGNPTWAPRLRHLPTWAFHGSDDNVVPVSQTKRMVEALEHVGAPVQLTIYDGVGHDSWTQTYDDPALYEWMLAQHRTAQELAAHAPRGM